MPTVCIRQILTQLSVVTLISFVFVMVLKTAVIFHCNTVWVFQQIRKTDSWLFSVHSSNSSGNTHFNKCSYFKDWTDQFIAIEIPSDCLIKNFVVIFLCMHVFKLLSCVIRHPVSVRTVSSCFLPLNFCLSYSCDFSFNIHCLGFLYIHNTGSALATASDIHRQMPTYMADICRDWLTNQNTDWCFVVIGLSTRQSHSPLQQLKIDPVCQLWSAILVGS